MGRIEWDLERSTASAWGRFRAVLADHIAGMRVDDILVIGAESAESAADVGADEGDHDAGGAAPYVQFCAWGEAFVRAEVSGNAYLAPKHALDDAGLSALTALGWAPPTVDDADADADADAGSANPYVDAERRDADRLATMAVGALRDVFGVVHPAFLRSDELGDALGRPGADLALPGGGLFETPGAEDEPLAVTPQDRDHLRALVDQALVPVFGEPPHHDGDGDVPVRAGSAMVFVQVPEHAPVVQLFSVVVVGVSDRERAAFEVAVLNRDQRFVTFVLSEDTVLAYVTIPGLPFAPEHLRAMLSLTVEMVDRVDDDLVARVGGHRWFDDEPEDASGDALGSAAEPGVAILDSAGEDDDELGCGDDVEEEWTGGHSTEPAVHPAMMTLLQLDAASPGSITPELAASICESDRDLLLALIGWNSEEEAEWQRGRDAARAVGDAAEAETCEQARRHAAATVGLLRGALRLVVEARLRADREQLVAGPVAPDGVASGPADASSALPGPHQRQDPFPAGAVMSRLNRTRPAPWDPGSPARRRRPGRRQDVLPGLEVPDSEPGLWDGSDGSED